ncbi:MAG: ABC transporter ATP-binding protein [Acidobacteriaceae bacterium]|nr:ABC transporter ATP-binding protein [Acidobacteriaceae bacterium]
MIHVDALSKSFHDRKRGTIKAVSNLSFDVAAGEIFGLLGPNGAGKTTTLRLLATVLRPSSGSATICGIDLVHDPDRARRRLGFLSGDMGHYGRLTPRQALMFFGRLNGVSKPELGRRAAELLHRFDLDSVADVKTDKLSTGMKQRLAIARCVVHDPPVLILDEPSAGLDVPGARSMEQFILEQKNAGKSIVFSSHVMEEAEYLCDRIAVVNQGELKVVGTMAELKALTGRTRLREVFLDLIGLTPEAKGVHA